MESLKQQSRVEDWCYSLTSGYLEDALIQFSVRLSPVGPPDSTSSDFNLSSQDCTFLSREEESKSMEEVISIPSEDLTDYEQGCCFSTASSSSFVPLLGVRNEERMRRRRMRRRGQKRVAYPFTLVKPVDEGELTLEEINKRIMMAPSRAVRHPVGDYACRPCVVSPRGPGLSGKAVVALTRIHTQGKGTITIVRTKD